MVDSYEREYRYRPGLGHSAPYQVSGHPFITGSVTLDSGIQSKVEFPGVAKSVTVINRTNVALRIHFTDKDVGDTTQNLHFITLDNKKDSVTFDIKCKEIYVTSQGAAGAYELFAELTSIHPNNMYALSGSGLTE